MVHDRDDNPIWPDNPMDRLRALRVFVRVAERGSFAAASADLGLSHGMASAVVKEIEAAHGIELIRRTTRRMALTDEGLAYLERARRILAEVESLDEDFSARAGGVTGRLTVQAPTAFARRVLAPSLGAFRAAHPALALSVLSRDRLADIVAENIDILVYVGALPDSGLVARRIGSFPLVTAAAPAYLGRRGVPAHPDALPDHDLIGITSATTGRPLDWQFATGGRRVLRPARSGLSFEASEAAIAAAVSGAGIVQNISYAITPHIAAGRLVPVLSAFRDPGPDMHIVTRRMTAVPARIRVFGEHLRHIARERADACAAILGAAGGGAPEP
jgi:LysR family transcriptional regulator for bpeEF and oprC